MKAEHLWDEFEPAKKNILVQTFNEVCGKTVPLELRWGRTETFRINDIRDFEFILGNYSDLAEERKGLMSQKDACYEACLILRERTGLPAISP